MSSRVIDITLLRRLKGLLNLARSTGATVTGISLIPAFIDWRLLFLPALLGWASVRVWRGSVTAAAILAALTLSAAVLSLHEYVTSPAMSAARDLAELRYAYSRKSYTRDFAILFLTLFVIFLASLVAAIVLRKVLPAPSDPRSPMVRLEQWLTRVGSRFTSRAALWYVLSVAFGACSAAPLLIDLTWVFGFRPLPREYSFIEGPTWLFLSGLAWILVFVVLSLRALTKAKRLAALSVAKSRSFDARSPVLLLRSFRDDMTPLGRTTDSRAWMRSIIHRHYFTLEEAAEDELSSYGPVIAIGRPGETLPPAGAAREYVSNEAWRGRIKAFIAEARLIVVILGGGDGLEFEYRALAELQALPRVIVVFPPLDEGTLNARWGRFAACALGDGEVVSQAESGRTLTALIDPDGPIFVTCRSPDDEDTYRLALRRSLAILSSEEKAAA